MPVKELMSWEPARQRWVKMYRGVRYRVSCSELRCMVWTQDGSRKAANEWWEAKLATLLPKAPPPKPWAEVPDDWQHGMDMRADAKAEMLVERGGTLPLGMTPDQTRWLFGAVDARAAHSGALSTVEQPDPINGTLGDLGGRFKQRRLEKHQDGKLSAAGATNSEYRLRHFLDFVGREKSANSITADTWERWHDRLTGKVHKGEMSPEWGKNIWATSRQFVKWLYSVEILPAMPRNFTDLTFRGIDSATEIDVYTVDEVRRMLAVAPPPARLHLLLALNCGFYSIDISRLQKADVDLATGTIRHRRGKTKHSAAHAPTVCYALWPETVAALRKNWSDHKQLATTNEDGKEWVRDGIRGDGKHTKTDGVRLGFARLMNRAKVSGRSFKHFRKTSASLLNTHPVHRGSVTYFLSNTPRTVTERHYARESDVLLAAALVWLRGEMLG